MHFGTAPGLIVQTVLIFMLMANQLTGFTFTFFSAMSQFRVYSDQNVLMDYEYYAAEV